MQSRFVGPIITTNALDVWSKLLTEGFQLQQVSRETLSSSDVEALWGLSDHSGETAMFETPGTPFGIRVIELDPSSELTIRHPASGYDCDALKVIDFFTEDFERARAHLNSLGFSLKDEIAEYDNPAGRITEGHLWGPDEVVCALVSGPKGFIKDYVCVADRLVSEVHSVSCPVEEPERVTHFYQSILELKEVHRYEVTDESFQHLVGASEPLHIRAVNVGVRKEEPYFGVIHYGLPEGSYQSLKERAVMPNRGMVGATVWIDDMDTLTERCAAGGVPVIAPVIERELAPYGPVESCAIRAPHGVLHHVISLKSNYWADGPFAPIRG